MTARMSFESVRALVPATPPPWEAGAVRIYSTADCPRHGPGAATSQAMGCACRTVVADARDGDRELMAAAPALRDEVLALHGDLARVTGERDAAADSARRSAEAAVTLADETGRALAGVTAERDAACRSYTSASNVLDAVRAALGTPDNADVIRHAGDLLTAAREYLDATEQWLASDIPTLRQEQRQERARDVLDALLAGGAR